MSAGVAGPWPGGPSGCPLSSCPRSRPPWRAGQRHVRAGRAGGRGNGPVRGPVHPDRGVHHRAARRNPGEHHLVPLDVGDPDPDPAARRAACRPAPVRAGWCAAHGGCDPARRPARGVPRAQRPGPVAVGPRDQSPPLAARPAGRHRRQPVAVVEDLHGQGAGGPGRGDPQLQRPRQRRVHGGLVAHHDRAGPRVGNPGEGRPAQVNGGCRAVRAHVHDFGPHRARRPGDIHVAAAGPAGRVAAPRQAGVPAPGRERAQPAAARRVAGIVEHGMTLDRGSGQRGPGQHGPGQHGPGQHGPGQHGPGQHGPG